MAVPRRIRRLEPGDERLLEEAEHLFDHPLQPAAARRFLDSETHHLLMAYEGETPVGFVTGVEMTHPDKGTEMFLHELGVNESFRGKGHGKALVAALADLARARSCYGMWVLTDGDNDAALATYRSVGGTRRTDQTLIDWEFAPRAEQA
ncbi:MAG TPA: GNAT family N-acetyltransferase [Chloroflexota bacterium]|nr:GNAT family N-acetyltransferase [Chloroflexota bacterium]